MCINAEIDPWDTFSYLMARLRPVTLSLVITFVEGKESLGGEEKKKKGASCPADFSTRIKLHVNGKDASF